MEGIRDVRYHSAYCGHQTPSECFINSHVCESCQQVGLSDLITDLNWLLWFTLARSSKNKIRKNVTFF